MRRSLLLLSLASAPTSYADCEPWCDNPCNELDGHRHECSSCGSAVQCNPLNAADFRADEIAREQQRQQVVALSYEQEQARRADLTARRQTFSSASDSECAVEQRVNETVQELLSVLESEGCNLPEFDDLASGEAAQTDEGFPFVVRLWKKDAQAHVPRAERARWAMEAARMQEQSSAALIDDLMSRYGT